MGNPCPGLLPRCHQWHLPNWTLSWFSGAELIPGQLSVISKVAFVMSRRNSLQFQTCSCLGLSQDHQSEHILWFCPSLVAQSIKKSACNAGDPGSILGWGRSSGEGNGYPLLESLGKKEIKPVSPKGNVDWKDWCWNELRYFGHLMRRPK